MVNKRETSSAGKSTALNTIKIRTRAALGTLALAMLAAVAVTLQKYRKEMLTFINLFF